MEVTWPGDLCAFYNKLRDLPRRRKRRVSIALTYSFRQCYNVARSIDIQFINGLELGKVWVFSYLIKEEAFYKIRVIL